MAIAPTKLWTIDDLDDLPDGRVEVWEGELVEMPAAGGQHSSVAGNILTDINVFNRIHQLGTVTGADGGFILSPDPLIMHVPDVAFVSKERAPEAPLTYFDVPPNLVVEVVSPSDRMTEVDAKVNVYLTHGVSVVWVVLPSRRVVIVHRADEPGTTREYGAGDELDGGEVLPGFRLPVSDIFR